MRSSDQRLNLGCGSHVVPGWINADFAFREGVQFVDARRPLPFRDGAFDVVYSSHLLEHLEPAVGAQLVGEAFRTLRPGGVVRLVVPDLEGICRLYLESLSLASETPEGESLWRLEWSRAELIDQMVRSRPGGVFPSLLESEHADWDFILSRFGDIARDMRDGSIPVGATVGQRVLRKLRTPARSLIELMRRVRAGAYLSRDPRRTGEAHRWMYDKLSLADLLRRSGFVDPAVMSWDSSQVAGWERENLDASRRVAGPRKPDSLYMEARKPAVKG